MTKTPTHDHHDPAFYIVTSEAISTLIDRHRLQIFNVVAETYRLHAAGGSVNPDSSFLRFRDKPDARIIALPAYLGGSVNRAGLKWIASFPTNHERCLARASAVLLLNDCETGFPVACLEASLISAHRTAASAALAAEKLTLGTRKGRLAVIGTGLIARTTVDWLLFRGWRFSEVFLYDTNRAAAEQFAKWLGPRIDAGCTITKDLEHATRPASLVLFATTAREPHVHDLDIFKEGPTVLHLSLRDLSVAQMLAAQNIVDDVDHCLKAQTSLHLTEETVGHRDFITGTLSEAMDDNLELDESRPRIFSPFGLGILDLAVGDRLFREALAENMATVVPRFFSHASRR